MFYHRNASVVNNAGVSLIDSKAHQTLYMDTRLDE